MQAKCVRACFSLRPPIKFLESASKGLFGSLFAR
jgi:hypothetical protein